MLHKMMTKLYGGLKLAYATQNVGILFTICGPISRRSIRRLEVELAFHLNNITGKEIGQKTAAF